MSKEKKSNKNIKASTPIESAKRKQRKRKRKKIDIKRYLMIGFIGLAMISFIFTSLPSNFSGMSKAKKSNNRSATSTKLPTQTRTEPTFKEEGTLQFVDAQGKALRSIRIEIADDEAQRTQGMMFRKSIPNDTGMLFIFPDESPRSFWMKNTYVPLDIIFVATDKTIVNIHENTPTLTEQRFESTAPAKYVVEVAGGFSKAYGIKAGDKIDFKVEE